MKKKINERSATGHLCLEPFVIGVVMVPSSGPILLKNESIEKIVILILVQVVVS